jgi:hypothetical protein
VLPLAGALALAATNDAIGRLDELLAARAGQGNGGPAVLAQLANPRVQAALDLLLAMPPAEIRKVRTGNSAVRPGRNWTAAERAAVDVLAPMLGMKVDKVGFVQVRVDDAQLIRVSLEAGKRSASVPLAWPTDWVPEAGALVDGSFENPLTLGVAWLESPAGVAVADPMRAQAGQSAVRVSARGEEAALSQSVRLAAGAPWAVATVVCLDHGRAGIQVLDGDAVRATRATQTAGCGALAANGEMAEPVLTLRLWVAPGGAATFDAAELIAAGVGGRWTAVPLGTVRLMVDRARDPDTRALEISLKSTVDAAQSRLAIPPGKEPVDVWLHSPSPGGCRVEGEALPARCPIAQIIESAWGAPGNAAAAALPLGLAGGIDGSNGWGRNAADPTTRDAGWTAWVLKRRGIAAMRELWQARDIAAWAPLIDAWQGESGPP